MSSLVGNKKYAIKDLIVSGPLNGDDILCIREMAGRDVNGLETSGNLVNLIMPTATIVEGGSPYYYNYSEGLTTKGNTFSNYFFANASWSISYSLHLSNLLKVEPSVTVGLLWTKSTYLKVSLVLENTPLKHAHK